MDIKNIIRLQLVIIVYTISSVLSKLAAGYKDTDIIKCLVFFGLEFVVLAIYAILWQQMIKKFDLSVAYANRSMAILWSMVWAVVFFRENITIKNVIGVIIVFVGTLIVNWDSGHAEIEGADKHVK